jgi:hypothetical protein
VNRVRTTAGLGATAALLALGWLAVRPPDPPARADESAPKVDRVDPAGRPVRVVGAVGCSGVACHGQTATGLVPVSGWGTAEADLQRWRSSAAVWKAYDPHARAFDVLGNEQSQQIEARLARADDAPHDARRDVRCLACHATPTLASDPKSPLLADGVSCEACHGSAGKWVGEHAGWPAGPGHSDRYAPAGMTKLSDPNVRATTCAGCHVGAPAGDGVPVRDMNHDLIAAGHPRLNFDYGTYLRSLPPHWTEKDRDVSPAKLRPATDEFRHWLVGRAATAAASYRLLADRAQRGPWPELAEFDCYACHHGLAGEKRKLLGHRPGALMWNEPPLGGLLTGLEVDSLRAAMTRPLDTGAITQQASETANKAKARSMSPAQVASKLADMKPRRWDEACHLYYALVAIDRAIDPTRMKPEDRRLTQIRAALKLPRESHGVRFNSPRGLELDGLPFGKLFRERSR